MICKNCSTEYDDSFAFCPSCGARKGTGITVTAPEDFSGADEKYAYEIPAYDGEEKVVEAVEVKPEGEKMPSQTEKTKKAEKKTVIAATGEEKKAMGLVIILLCIVAVAGVCLSALNVKTETFEAQSQPQKAVALTKLSAEEQSVLEMELSKYFSVLKQNFSCVATDAESFIARLNPADSGGILAKLGAIPLTIRTEADPAMRFKDEYGEYAYYKIPAGEIDKILERFCLTSYGDVNSKNCYYYDGFYYMNSTQADNTPPVTAKINKSKKVLDGSFYVECSFAISNGAETINSNNCYLIAEKNSESAFDGYTFRICKANLSPLFTDAGNPTAANSGAAYTVETKVIEGKTNDGKVYSRYTVEYPVFSGKTAGINAINQFYTNLVSSYEQKAAAAQQDYESFIAQGGKAEELPFTETVVARVTYSDGSRISCMEKIATYSPEIPVKEEETTTAEYENDRYYEQEYNRNNENGYFSQQEEEQVPVKLFTRTVEAYTFDTATGDFISKDAVLGKDYMLISEILYRIYNAYDYTSVIPEEVTEESTSATETTEPLTDEFGYPVEQQEDEDRYYNDYDSDYRYDDYYDYSEEEKPDDGIPEDEYGFGTMLYESTCAFTESGFTFWYVEDEGYVTEVTIPFDVIEKLVK